MEKRILSASEEARAYAALLYEVLIQAIEDVRALQAAGVLDGSRFCAAEWPKTDGPNPERIAVRGYKEHAEVDQLLMFLTSKHLQLILDHLGVNVSVAQVHKSLGITGPHCPTPTRPEAIPDYKVCTRCGLEKPLKEYHKHGNTKDGHNVICKACKSNEGKERHARAKRSNPAAHKSAAWGPGPGA